MKLIVTSATMNAEKVGFILYACSDMPSLLALFAASWLKELDWIELLTLTFINLPILVLSVLRKCTVLYNSWTNFPSRDLSFEVTL